MLMCHFFLLSNKCYSRWVMMPPEIAPDNFLCDPKCSHPSVEDNISVLSWYEHVLPQLRRRKFYGRALIEIVQGPGETIYMPVNQFLISSFMKQKTTTKKLRLKFSIVNLYLYYILSFRFFTQNPKAYVVLFSRPHSCFTN